MKHLIDTVNNLKIEDYAALLKRISKNHFVSLTSFKEKFFLLLFAEQLKNNSTIVEVGTYLGGTASIMAKANLTSKIYCFDCFDNYNIPASQKIRDAQIDQSIGRGKERTIENIREFLKDYNNIELFKVENRNSVVDYWSKEIDVYFEDGNHWDPILTKNVDYWSQWIKPGGFMMLHDYSPNWPDVTELVKKYQNNDNWNFLGTVDTLAIFQKINTAVV